MITFKRDGTNVRMSVGINIPHFEARSFHFNWNCGQEYAAALLTAEMQKQLDTAIGEIRRKEYDRGWRDAKAKRRKSGLHLGHW